MSNSKKRNNNTLSSQQNKKIRNDNDLLYEEPQWVDVGSNKTSWVWKYFGVKTD
ncbi:25827_t:CDS:1, partial [Gigaspora rosea]